MAGFLIGLSGAAAERIRTQMPADEAGVALRVAARRLEDGSFHYAMGFDVESREGDVREVVETIALVVDAASVALVRGMTIDYVELEPGQEQFIFLNPNDPAYVAPESDA